MQMFKYLVLIACVATAMHVNANAADISGGGATLPDLAYLGWAEQYGKDKGHRFNYRMNGSEAGITQILSGTITFGASDRPMRFNDLERAGLVQFPMLYTGVVPIINLEGIKPGEMVFDGPTLGKIFQGEVRSWNDAAIQKLNPGIKLPARAIVPVQRADGSGTTYAFTDYLSKVSPRWKTPVMKGEWTTGVSRMGNEGIISEVMRTPGSIGYVGHPHSKLYSQLYDIAYTRMLNKSGNIVAPNLESFAAAANKARWSKTPGFGVVLTDQIGEEAWPIVTASFILMHKRPRDPTDSRNALDYFHWAYEYGDDIATRYGYVSIPKKIVPSIEQLWQREVRGPDGGPAWRPPLTLK